MITNQSRFNFLSYFLFFIWPLFSLFYACLNFTNKQSKNIVWLFCGFFGYTFVISSEGMDAAYYRDMLIRLHESNIPISDFWRSFNSNTSTDYIQPLITYFISQFTRDSRILFMVYGLIFGYFYSRNIFFLLEKVKFKSKTIGWIILFFFIFLNPIWNINGIRFWVATQIYIYGSFLIFLGGRKKGYIFLVLSFLMHFSFVGPVFIFIVNLLIPNNLILRLSLLLCSIILIKVSVFEIIKYFPLTGGAIDGRIKGYSDQSVIDTYFSARDTRTWFLVWYEIGLQYLSYVLLIIMSLNLKLVKLLKLLPIFNLGVLILTVSNIVQVIPSMNRFYTIAEMLICATFFLYIEPGKNTLSHKIILPVLVLFFVFFIIITGRLALDQMGLYSLLLNPLLAPFFEMDYALNSLFE